MQHRIAITGMGCVTPLGCDVDQVWSDLISGHSGIQSVKVDNPEQFRSTIAGLVKGFEQDSLPKGYGKKFDKFINYGLFAANKAILDSNIIGHYDPARIACIVGSGIGGLGFQEKNIQVGLTRGPHRISPYYVPGTIINTLPGLICMDHQIKGPSFSVISACASGAHNIIIASQLIQSGLADAVVCGASEGFSKLFILGGFSALRALSTLNSNPTKASRPWDKSRDGFVAAEGAGILVLEREDMAKSRGQTIYSYIKGYGLSSDAYRVTLPHPDGEGVISSMKQSLQDVNIADVKYVNAHATSTPAGDITELRATEKVFDGHLNGLKMSSTKSSIGHTLGAAGSIEAIFCVQSLIHQLAPPTLNLVEPEVETPIDLVQGVSQKMNSQYALSNSFGFGGQNASILFERP